MSKSVHISESSSSICVRSISGRFDSDCSGGGGGGDVVLGLEHVIKRHSNSLHI